VEPIPQTREALAELTNQGDPEVGVALLRMGRKAREVAPACVGLSLSMLDEDLTFTLVASSQEVAGLDAVQYLDGGPCVRGSHTGETVDVRNDDMITEQEWLMYAQACAAAGVRSSLTLPIVRSERVIGTVNLYGATPDAFDGLHEQLASALGVTAENAVVNADLSFRTRLEAEQAPRRLADQDDVDIALGTIARHQGVDIATAQIRLRSAAARAGITEGQAARAVLGVLMPDQRAE
jgi:GAF domain-containing protein